MTPEVSQAQVTPEPSGGCRTVGCGDTVGTGVVGVVVEGHRDGLLGIGEIVVDVEARSDSDRIADPVRLVDGQSRCGVDDRH